MSFDKGREGTPRFPSSDLGFELCRELDVSEGFYRCCRGSRLGSSVNFEAVAPHRIELFELGVERLGAYRRRAGGQSSR